MRNILYKTKLVKGLLKEIEDLRHELASEKAVCEIAKKNAEEKAGEAEHSRAIAYAILSKNHLCRQSRTGKLSIVLEKKEIDEAMGKVIHEDLNFPMTSITVYPE